MTSAADHTSSVAPTATAQEVVEVKHTALNRRGWLALPGSRPSGFGVLYIRHAAVEHQHRQTGLTG